MSSGDGQDGADESVGVVFGAGVAVALPALLEELLRLAQEANERIAEGAVLAGMSSLAALEPIRETLLQQCVTVWKVTETAGSVAEDEVALSPDLGYPGYL